jgi:CheY-like chemotaxis protein
MPSERLAAPPWILVVEDEEDIRDIICMVLEDAGVQAVPAGDGREALDRMRLGPPPRLIVLDMMMPGMDGWEFRRAQLEDPRLAAIPVLVLSGDGQVQRKAAEIGAVGWLGKPFDFDQLMEQVDRYAPEVGPPESVPRP